MHHVDLANSPFVQKQVILPNQEIITTGHSHVLVDYLLNPHIIDLEGKSTIYTETPNKQLKKRSLDKTILTLEFLLRIDYDLKKKTFHKK